MPLSGKHLHQIKLFLMIVSTGLMNLDSVAKSLRVLHTQRMFTTDRNQDHQPTTILYDTVQEQERINSSHIDVS